MAKRFDGHPAGTTPGTITVLKLEKSGGCVDRDETYMQQLQHAQIKAYFFGDARRTLSPHTQTVDFNAITVFKITECLFPFHLLLLSKVFAS
jgi:polyribonucleotide 5'-hydroxyl-kinase